MQLTKSQWQGVAVWELRTAQALARISCFGGQLLSWQPAGQEEVFWCSGQLQPPRALRGGVPLCWPWFGAHDSDPSAPAHGLARTAPWQLQQVNELADGRVHLQLVPAADLYPDLQLEQQLCIGQQLEHRITSHNVGEAPVVLSQALHSYFRVADVSAVQVEGLAGLRYSDALQAGRVGQQSGHWQFDAGQHGGRCDRIYQGVAQALVLHDHAGRRRLQLRADGGTSVVLWTPGPELGRQMPDVGEGWQHYLCLEVANAGEDARLLEPGQRHVLAQSIVLLD